MNDGFVYNCEKCGSLVGASIVNRCASCGIKLCRNCSTNELCGAHFYRMNIFGREMVSKRSKIILGSWIIYFSYLIITLILMIFFNFDKFAITEITYTGSGISQSSTNYVVIYLTVGMFFGPAIPLIMRKFLRDSIKKISRDYQQKHTNTQEEEPYRGRNDASTKKISPKYCFQCGNEVDNNIDSLSVYYCSQCGYEIKNS